MTHPVPPREVVEKAYFDHGNIVSAARTVFGVSGPTFRHWLVFHHIPVVGNRRSRPTNDELRDAREKYKTVRACAEHFGVSYITARVWMAEAGVPKQARHKIPSKESVAAAYAKNKTLRLAAEQAGVCLATFYRWMIHHGIPRRRPGTVESVRPSRDVFMVLLQTKTYTEIGKLYGVSRQAVDQWANYFGVKERVPGPEIDNRNSDIVRDYQSGWTRKELAEEHGLNVRTINAIIRRTLQ